MTCSQTHKTLGQCQQPPLEFSVFCAVHYRMDNDPNYNVDKYYHEKVVRGLVDITDEYLTQTEINAMFRGRARNDGRRLDHYVRGVGRHG